MLITDNSTKKCVFYAPGLGDIDEGVIEDMKQSNCLLVDGTCWTNEEMITQNLGTKKALEMGHLPQTGDSGMIKILETMPDQTRKILIHINNSNPILNDMLMICRRPGRPAENNYLTTTKNNLLMMLMTLMIFYTTTNNNLKITIIP